MNNHNIVPGIAAIVLALLFPLYWTSVLAIGVQGMDFMTVLRQDMLQLSGMDALFVLIGALEIYIYFNLVKIFDNRLTSQATKILLFILIGSVFVFHAVVFADLFLASAQSTMHPATINIVINTSIFLSVASLIIYIMAGIGLSIVLLTRSEAQTGVLKAFAIMLLIICLLQATMIFAVANIILFPIALVILAVYFFKDPDTLEVV